MISKIKNSKLSNKEKEQQVYAFLATQGVRINTPDLDALREGNSYAAVIGADGYKVFDMPNPKNAISVRRGVYSLDILTETYNVLTHSGRDRHTIDYQKAGHIHIDDPVSFMVLGLYELDSKSHLKHILDRLKSGENLEKMLEESETELAEAEVAA